MSFMQMLSPYFAWQVICAVCGYLLFLVRGTCIAIADFWVMYVRVGKVWREPLGRAPSLERRDLVMQLSAQSATHSRLCATDELLHLNEGFVDRGLWRGLSEASAAPSVLVTGVSYGGIGFYTALHVLLSGANVHGVVRSPAKAEEAEWMMQAAVDRQCRLHKDWAGRVGRVMMHTCDMSDTVAVYSLADKLFSDPNLRVVVCNAGPMSSPLRLTPQRLEEQFATHHVGHSLLLLRLLQHRLDAANGADSSGGSTTSNSAGGSRHRGGALPSRSQYASPAPPHWRIVIMASGAASTANPTAMTTFHKWSSVDNLWWHLSRFSGYGNAKMCEQLFAFGLARFVASDRQLAPYCTVNALHPGPIRSRVIPNSGLPMRWLLDGEMAALFRMTPVIASLYVTDLCLSRRHDQTSGHFFRMGEDQTAHYADMVADPKKRWGWFRNSTLFPGIPGPRVSLSETKQDWLWNATLAYMENHGLIESNFFR